MELDGRTSKPGAQLLWRGSLRSGFQRRPATWPANVPGVIEIKHRTEIQLVLAAMGLVVWGYGARNDDRRLTWIGVAFFAAGAVLRFFKKRPED
jgi:hypothetical protein